MTKSETNIFPISNLSELSSAYRLYQIRGLRSDHEGYFSNRQHIIRKLSYDLKSPITIIDKESSPHLVVETDIQDIPSSMPLVRSLVHFEPIDEEFILDYSKRSSQNDQICLRFLQFLLQAPLRRNNELWQPGSGQPFFWKKPSFSTSRLGRYTGFSVRAIITSNGGLGFCVDVTNKFIGKKSLPTYLSGDEFWRWKDQHCIYHFGHQWFNIQVNGLSDFNVCEHMIPDDGKYIPLLELILRESKKPVPPELAELSHDVSVVLYSNNTGDERSAPTSLCYPVFGTDDRYVQRYHRQTILAPYKRRELIHEFANRYLQNLKFGNQQIKLNSAPLTIKRRRFANPDLLFGNNVVLSTRGTNGAIQVDANELGKTRLDLLFDKNAGLYIRDPLLRQYVIIPQSVYESYGESFIKDLSKMVDSLFPQPAGFSPILVTYNDHVSKTFFKQGKAILEAIELNCNKDGYALVMIHHIEGKKPRHEDQLEAMVIRECRERGITAAVIHSKISKESYHLITPNQGDPFYAIRRKQKPKFIGYLRNVALNHILLNNERWPFVLATPLNADITIGVDVKHNTAGLLAVGKRGERVRSLRRTSRQKEKLLADQIHSYLVEVLKEELADASYSIRNIVIHRDGRVFESEISGCKAAINQLIQEGYLESSVELTILEIPKTSPVRLRLFDISRGYGGRTNTYNPHEGDFYIVGDDGYLCTTGSVFLHNGTARPLHVRRVSGSLSLEKCLEDIYYLSSLVWTRPEGCMRDPITTKLNDRFLSEDATEYDAEGLEYAMHITDEVIV